MKKTFINIFSVVMLAATVASCKKDEATSYFEGGTAPVLTASSTAPLVLKKENKDNVAMVLRWTNPNYQFSTGPSSQDVVYYLQVDTTGKNFTSAGMQELAIPKELTSTLTVKDLNGFLSRMELKSGTEYNVELRIKSVISGGAAALYSNVIKIKLTPYLDFAVEPPGTPAAQYNDGNLWVTGDAFASGWSNPLLAPYLTSQKFTKIDVLHYQLIVTFNATGGYKLIQEQGIWSSQYHALAPADALSGTFEKRDADPQFPSPGAGSYKIEVNFQTGKYTLTKQ
ncbi:MAG: SusE domain-containing protein [Ferruginibacter sp.]